MTLPIKAIAAECLLKDDLIDCCGTEYAYVRRTGGSNWSFATVYCKDPASEGVCRKTYAIGKLSDDSLYFGRDPIKTKTFHNEHIVFVPVKDFIVATKELGTDLLVSDEKIKTVFGKVFSGGESYPRKTGSKIDLFKGTCKALHGNLVETFYAIPNK